MPIAYRSTGTGSTGAAATSITTNTPSGVADGDLLVWTLALNAATVVAEPPEPAGWRRLAVFQVVGAGPSQGQVSWFRWAKSEPANYVISSLASGRYAAHMHAFTGVDSISVEDVTETQTTNSSGESSNPAITPVTPGAWVLAEESDSAASGVTNTTYSSSNATQIGTISSTSASTINAALGAAYLDTWTSGAFTPNLVPTGTIARSCATTLVLRPAAAGVAVRQTIFAPRRAPTRFLFQRPSAPAAAASDDANLNVADTGSGTDTATLAAAVPATDTVAGTDTATVAAAPTAADTGSEADTASLAAAITASDTATGVDTATVDTGATQVSGADTGTGANNATLAAAIAAADTAAGPSSASVAASLTASDSAVAVDSASVMVLITGTDNATATALATLAAAASAADLATALDNGSTPGSVTADPSPITATIRDRGHTTTAESVGASATHRAPPARATIGGPGASATARPKTVTATIEENQ